MITGKKQTGRSFLRFSLEGIAFLSFPVFVFLLPPSLCCEELFVALKRLEQLSPTSPEESRRVLKEKEILYLFLLYPSSLSPHTPPEDPELLLISALREHGTSPTTLESLGSAIEALPLDPRTRLLLKEYFTRGPLRTKGVDPLFKGAP